MNTRSVQVTRVLALLVLVAWVPLLAGCSGSFAIGPAPCSAPRGGCSCPPTSGANGTVVYLIVPGRSADLTSTVDDMTADGAAAFDGGAYGVHSVPMVMLGVYGDDGSIIPHGEFNLAGNPSADDQEASAALEAACLQRAVADLPAPEGPTNLFYAVQPAAQIALANAQHVAVVAFGLGSSVFVDPVTHQTFSTGQLDLSPTGQQEIVERLRQYLVLGPPGSYALTFVDPANGIDDPHARVLVTDFAQHALCAMYTTVPCTWQDSTP